MTESAPSIFHSGQSPGRRPLGALLVDAGLIDEDRLEEALDEGSRTGERLGEVVVRHGWATEDDVAKLLADQWGLPYVERWAIRFDADALSRLSREQAMKLEALPTHVDGGRVVVAVAEPTEARTAALAQILGDDATLVVVPKTALDLGLRSELLARDGSEDEPKPRPPAPVALVPPPPAAAPEPALGGAAADALRASVEALAGSVERLTGRVLELRAALDQVRVDRERDSATIAGLEEQLRERDRSRSRIDVALRDLLTAVDRPAQ